eukprot:357499-Chlamydomonas_euryale.AAC.11
MVVIWSFPGSMIWRYGIPFLNRDCVALPTRTVRKFGAGLRVQYSVSTALSPGRLPWSVGPHMRRHHPAGLASTPVDA